MTDAKTHITWFVTVATLASQSGQRPNFPHARVCLELSAIAESCRNSRVSLMLLNMLLYHKGYVLIR